ncbi:MAG: hypothetical protein WCO79_02365 [bacterium]
MTEAQENSKKKKKEVIEYNDENHELPFLNPKKISQGQRKILRLVDDLVRNRSFMRALKRVIRIENKRHEQYKAEHIWTSEETSEHSYFNYEIGRIIDDYEALKKRADKLIHNKEYKIREKLASEYGLDTYLVSLAVHRYKGDKFQVATDLVEGGELLRMSMTRNIKSIKTRYRLWKLNFLNTQKPTMITKRLLLQSSP